MSLSPYNGNRNRQGDLSLPFIPSALLFLHLVDFPEASDRAVPSIYFVRVVIIGFSGFLVEPNFISGFKRHFFRFRFSLFLDSIRKCIRRFARPVLCLAVPYDRVWFESSR